MKKIAVVPVILSLLLTACWNPYGDGVGVYYKSDSKTDYTELKSDGTYEFHEKGKAISGTYSVRWNTITLILPNGKTATGKLYEDHIVDNQMQKWYLKTATP